ncbi:AraC family transcriptional regulator [Cohnella soli]|uniref:Helix-turn-helix domain-containing protein n=1 Tax=Cohnella soli TaxID=425005 RepID=A0ABW0HR02_9BACL
MAAESMIKFICYGKGVAPSHWTFDHFPYVNRLYYVFGGTAYFTGGQMRHQLKPGHLYLFPYGIEFSAVHDGADCLDHLYFDFVTVPPLQMDRFAEYRVEPNTVVDHLTRALTLYLSDDHTARDEVTVRTLFQGLLAVFCETYGIERLNDSRINRVLELIHEKYGDNLCNRYFADLLHLDLRHFLRIFKQALKMTPNKYIREYRMTQAEAMLRKRESIQDVATRTGYESAASFCHAFKRSRGMSPSAFIKQNSPVE